MLNTLKQMINDSQNIVFFGGAGVSTESGIPDFRSADGLYRQNYAYSPETILSHAFFHQHPEEFFNFYREKMLFPQAKPNQAHLALARLEELGKLKTVITQNIDGLHQVAGSHNVLELHGSIHRNTCLDCNTSYTLAQVQATSGIPRCACGGSIKPDVVLYGEPLPQATVHSAIKHLLQAEMLIIGGTSLNVYPAAGLIDYYQGDKLVLINKTPTPADSQADLVFQEAIGEVLGRVVG